MQDYFYSLMLALLQALTEFLPVSSSGHLHLLRKALAIGLDSFGLFYDVVVHVGTMLATLYVFRKELKGIMQKLLNEVKTAKWKDDFATGYQESEGIKTILFIMISTMPLVILGIVGKDVVELYLLKPLVLSVGFAVTTLVLIANFFFSKKKGNELKQLNFFFPIVVGMFQMLAITPGISRSGMTIAAGIMMGANRKTAGEYAFFISFPAITGATLLMLMDIEMSRVLENIGIYLIGLLGSFTFGVMALKFLISFVARGKLHFFAVYTFIVFLYSLNFL